MHEKDEMPQLRPDLGEVKLGCSSDASRHQNQTKKKTGKGKVLYLILTSMIVLNNYWKSFQATGFGLLGSCTTNPHLAWCVIAASSLLRAWVGWTFSPKNISWIGGKPMYLSVNGACSSPDASPPGEDHNSFLFHLPHFQPISQQFHPCGNEALLWTPHCLSGPDVFQRISAISCFPTA